MNNSINKVLYIKVDMPQARCTLVIINMTS